MNQLEVVEVGSVPVHSGGRADVDDALLERSGFGEEVRETEAREALDGKVRFVAFGREGEAAVRRSSCA